MGVELVEPGDLFVDDDTVFVRTIRGPERAAEIREAILLELDRAARALQMVEHGCGILGSVGVGGRELRPGQSRPEEQTGGHA